MAEAQVQQDAVASREVETRSRREDFLRAFFTNRLAIFGTAVMAVFVLMAVFAPLLAPYDPLETDLPRSSPGRAWHIRSGKTSWAATSSRA